MSRVSALRRRSQLLTTLMSIILGVQCCCMVSLFGCFPDCEQATQFQPDAAGFALANLILGGLPEATDQIVGVLPTSSLSAGSLFGVILQSGKQIQYLGTLNGVGQVSVSGVILFDTFGNFVLRQDFRANGTTLTLSNGDMIDLQDQGGSTRVRYELNFSRPPSIVQANFDANGDLRIDEFATVFHPTLNLNNQKSSLAKTAQLQAQATGIDCSAITNGLIASGTLACRVNSLLAENITERSINLLCLGARGVLEVDLSANPALAARADQDLTALCEISKTILFAGANLNAFGLACLALDLASNQSQIINGQPLGDVICDLFKGRAFVLTVVGGTGSATYDAGTEVGIMATPPAGQAFVEWTGDVDSVEDVNASSTTVTVISDITLTASFLRLTAPSVLTLMLPERRINVSVSATFTSQPTNPVGYLWSGPNGVFFTEPNQLTTTAALPAMPGMYPLTLTALKNGIPFADTTTTVTLLDEAIDFTTRVDPERGSVIQACSVGASVDVLLFGEWDNGVGFAAQDLRIQVVQFSPFGLQARAWIANSAVFPDGTWRTPLSRAFAGNDGPGQYEFEAKLVLKSNGQVLANGTVFFVLEQIFPQQLTDVVVNTSPVDLLVRDFGSEDGDLVRIILCGSIEEEVLLTNANQTITLNLNLGENPLEILALNEGSASPNTAEFTIAGFTQRWELMTGQLATMSIFFQP